MMSDNTPPESPILLRSESPNGGAQSRESDRIEKLEQMMQILLQQQVENNNDRMEERKKAAMYAERAERSEEQNKQMMQQFLQLQEENRKDRIKQQKKAMKKAAIDAEKAERAEKQNRKLANIIAQLERNNTKNVRAMQSFIADNIRTITELRDRIAQMEELQAAGAGVPVLRPGDIDISQQLGEQMMARNQSNIEQNDPESWWFQKILNHGNGFLSGPYTRWHYALIGVAIIVAIGGGGYLLINTERGIALMSFIASAISNPST